MLVVDDDSEMRAVFAEYLSLRGFRVLEAVNGLEALLRVKHDRPDTIILDLAMPRLGGIETLKRIVKFDPTIAVVVVTGAADTDLHRQASLLGVRAILGKPVNLPDLVPLLTRRAPSRPDVVPLTERPDRAESASAVREVWRGRILVVDDEPDVRAVLTEFAAAKGYTVHAVSSGTEAIGNVAQDPPDVVLLDIEMPGLAGTEALIAIRAVAPNVKVIMVSGTSDAGLAQRALTLGAFDYVTKPIDMEHLAQSLETAVMMKRCES